MLSAQERSNKITINKIKAKHTKILKNTLRTTKLANIKRKHVDPYTGNPNELRRQNWYKSYVILSAGNDNKELLKRARQSDPNLVAQIKNLKLKGAVGAANLKDAAEKKSQKLASAAAKATTFAKNIKNQNIKKKLATFTQNRKEKAIKQIQSDTKKLNAKKIGEVSSTWRSAVLGNLSKDTEVISALNAYEAEYKRIKNLKNLLNKTVKVGPTRTKAARANDPNKVKPVKRDMNKEKANNVKFNLDKEKNRVAKEELEKELKNIESKPLSKPGMRAEIAKFVLRKHSKPSELKIDIKDVSYATTLIENKPKYSFKTNAKGTFLVVNPVGNLALARSKDDGNVPTTTSNKIKKEAAKAKAKAAEEAAKAKANAEAAEEAAAKLEKNKEEEAKKTRIQTRLKNFQKVHGEVLPVNKNKIIQSIEKGKPIPPSAIKKASNIKFPKGSPLSGPRGPVYQGIPTKTPNISNKILTPLVINEILRYKGGSKKLLNRESDQKYFSELTYDSIKLEDIPEIRKTLLGTAKRLGKSRDKVKIVEQIRESLKIIPTITEV
tara:strand:- start:108 stop:1760 length:1653 start_codon:yes stop_codon:yes gene_type:complete